MIDVPFTTHRYTKSQAELWWALAFLFDKVEYIGMTRADTHFLLVDQRFRKLSQERRGHLINREVDQLWGLARPPVIIHPFTPEEYEAEHADYRVRVRAGFR